MPGRCEICEKNCRYLYDCDHITHRMLVKINIVTMRNVQLEIAANDRIEVLKEKIHEMEGIPTDMQSMRFSKKLLQDGKRLKDYSIGNGAVLDLSVVKPTHIFVKNLHNQEYTFKVDISMQVADLKNMIYDRDGIPPHLQRLTYGAKNLDNSKCLRDYNIQNDGTINVLARINGQI